MSSRTVLMLAGFIFGVAVVVAAVGCGGRLASVGSDDEGEPREDTGKYGGPKPPRPNPGDPGSDWPPRPPGDPSKKDQNEGTRIPGAVYPLAPNSCLALTSALPNGGGKGEPPPSSPPSMHIVSFALATRNVTLGPAVDLPEHAIHISSIGLFGEWLYTCTPELVRIHAITGRIERAGGVSCEAATTDSEGIWILSMASSRTFNRYAGLAEIIAGTPSASLPAPHASRIGPAKSGLLAAWHSAGSIDRIDPETRASKPVALQGFDTWIFGVSEAPYDRIVISATREGSAPGTNGELVIFHGTGTKITHIKTASQYFGVACSMQ